MPKLPNRLKGFFGKKIKTGEIAQKERKIYEEEKNLIRTIRHNPELTVSKYLKGLKNTLRTKDAIKVKKYLEKELGSKKMRDIKTEELGLFFSLHIKDKEVQKMAQIFINKKKIETQSKIHFQRIEINEIYKNNRTRFTELVKNTFTPKFIKVYKDKKFSELDPKMENIKFFREKFPELTVKDFITTFKQVKELNK